MKTHLSAFCIVLCFFMCAHAHEKSNPASVDTKNQVPATGLIVEGVVSAPSDSIGRSGRTPPPDLIEVDAMPTLKSRKDPYYPEAAQQAGIEGVVYVKILVGPDGKPRQVEVAKSDAEVLNDAAVDAAKRFLFTPAYKDNKPVDVWVTVPFKFKLAPGKKQIERNAQELPSKVNKPTVLIVAGPKALKDLINYPDEAVRKRVEGAVSATVRLNEKKHAIEVRIISGIGSGCDEEVLHALSSYKFYEDKDLSRSDGSEAVSIAVQFILPAGK